MPAVATLSTRRRRCSSRTAFVVLSVLDHGIPQDLRNAIVGGTKATRDANEFLFRKGFSHLVIEIDEFLELGLHVVGARVVDFGLVGNQRILKRIQMAGGNLQQLVLEFFGQDTHRHIGCDQQEGDTLHLNFPKGVQHARPRAKQGKQVSKGRGPTEESDGQPDSLLEGSLVSQQQPIAGRMRFRCYSCGSPPAPSHSQKDFVVGDGFESTLYNTAPDLVFGLREVSLVHQSQFGQGDECIRSSVDEFSSSIDVEFGLGGVPRRPAPGVGGFRGLFFLLFVVECWQRKDDARGVVGCCSVGSHLRSSGRQQSRRCYKAVVRKVTRQIRTAIALSIVTFACFF
mmetsp:Transcript_14901/g.33610  ORF Transcript_14901/g.33610 Transcript_14901/m.33610 type:complete len:342 (+) Transcript_14901:1958-2983(+)